MLITNPIDKREAPALLQAWHWLVEQEATILVVSVFGDLFLQYPNESVYWLDTGTGDLTRLAANVAEFQALLQQPENAAYWLLPDLANEAQQTGLAPGPHEVYSFILLPVLGGEYTPENLRPTHLQAHLNLTGVLNEQIRNLPDGTKVTFQVTE
ncbi:T6SS immunity protein Tdi1 domain-containing protein [Hymenobacter sp. B81]|uniref:T6SS immunity protein Tdi1 domain-containing protein n=1 Tax=Hymenobacter sp. B81 TaxID=3344878 RepID=UPI0037DD6B85